MRRKMPKYVWVSRADVEEACYSLWFAKPIKENSYWYSSRSHGELIHAGMCPEVFELMSGMNLEPGTCKRIRWRSFVAE